MITKDLPQNGNCTYHNIDLTKPHQYCGVNGVCVKSLTCLSEFFGRIKAVYDDGKEWVIDARDGSVTTGAIM